MTEIKIIRDAEADWQEVRPEWAAKYKADDPGLKFKRLLPGDVPAMPNMQRSQYHPHHHEPPHSHPEDEILYVLSGRVFFGREELGAGDAIYVPQGKVYSLRTGETGAEFLRVGFGELSAPSG
jgi:quercetin dioxygenase-like cupin family protein